MSGEITVDTMDVAGHTASVEYHLGVPMKDSATYDLWCDSTTVVARSDKVKEIRNKEPFKSRIDRLVLLSGSVGIVFKDGVEICSMMIH